MSADIAALAYLVSGALFILALRGLSSPETSRRGNLLGMTGMAIAIVTTLVLADIAEGLTWGLIVLGVGLGGSVGAVIARRIPRTAMPQLVAAFHSLVGMAAVLVAAAALNTPDAYGIGTVGEIRVASLVEMSIGSAIGAITFTGSVVAFTKLQGLVSGRPGRVPRPAPAQRRSRGDDRGADGVVLPHRVAHRVLAPHPPRLRPSAC